MSEIKIDCNEVQLFGFLQNGLTEVSLGMKDIPEHDEYKNHSVTPEGNCVFETFAGEETEIKNPFIKKIVSKDQFVFYDVILCCRGREEWAEIVGFKVSFQDSDWCWVVIVVKDREAVDPRRLLENGALSEEGRDQLLSILKGETL